MNPLLRWDPFKEMEDLQSRFTRLFGLTPARTENGGRELMTITEWAPSVDIIEDEKEWLVKADRPEVNKENVKVTVAVGRDDDQVRLQSPCRIRDFMEGAALADECPLNQLRVDVFLLNKRLKLRYARSQKLVVLHHERERIGKAGRCHWLHHVQQCELRTELLREGHGIIQNRFLARQGNSTALCDCFEG
jgi:hypothetical protein